MVSSSTTVGVLVSAIHALLVRWEFVHVDTTFRRADSSCSVVGMLIALPFPSFSLNRLGHF